AVTVPVGTVTAELSRLLATCERALWHGLAAAEPGARLGDVSHAVERCARAGGPGGRAGTYGIVEDYVGHGIGSEMHRDPAGPHLGRPGRGPGLAAGQAPALEPPPAL